MKSIGFHKHLQTTELFFGIDICRRQFRRKMDAFLTDHVFRNFAFCFAKLCVLLILFLI